MKRLLLLCLLTLSTTAWSAQGNEDKHPQPFSAVLWTTTTLHTRAGKPMVFTQRTVVSRDSSGKVRREIHRPTHGLSHDESSPLQSVLTNTTSALESLPTTSRTQEFEQSVDLGTGQFSGLSARGQRQTFRDAHGEFMRSQETWFSSKLGLVVHTESANQRGDTVLTDLSELHLGEPAPPSTENVPASSSTIPLLTLYRDLFAQIAHMERDRLANDPNRHVNMNEIEDHLRKKIDLSAQEWQTLVDKSVKVESDTRERSQKARAFAKQNRAARQQDALSVHTLAAGRATLHSMQSDLNTHVQGEVEDLKNAVGPTATGRIQAYLQGPLAASMHAIPVKSIRLQVQQAEKEQSR